MNHEKENEAPKTPNEPTFGNSKQNSGNET
jgi:hypothetical protein